MLTQERLVLCYLHSTLAYKPGPRQSNGGHGVWTLKIVRLHLPRIGQPPNTNQFGDLSLTEKLRTVRFRADAQMLHTLVPSMHSQVCDFG